MTPKEEAQELVNRFMPFVDEGWHDLVLKSVMRETKLSNAKECALIAIEEKISTLSVLPYGIEYLSNVDYYEGLKQEIQNL